MGEIVSLNRARKTQAKTQARKTAEANRAAFGRTKTEKRLSETIKSVEDLRLDGHRLRDD
jgi:hypothetical protein